MFSIKTRRRIGVLAGITAVGLSSSSAAADTGQGKDPWECAPAAGVPFGACQTYSVDEIQLLTKDGTVVGSNDCTTGHPPDPADAPGPGLCGLWGTDVPGMFAAARAAGAERISRHSVNQMWGDRRLTITVPAADDAPAFTLHATGQGTSVYPAYDHWVTAHIVGKSGWWTDRPASAKLAKRTGSAPKLRAARTHGKAHRR